MKHRIAVVVGIGAALLAAPAAVAGSAGKRKICVNYVTKARCVSDAGNIRIARLSTSATALVDAGTVTDDVLGRGAIVIRSRVAGGLVRSTSFTMYFAHATLSGSLKPAAFGTQLEIIAGGGEWTFTKGTGAAKGRTPGGAGSTGRSVSATVATARYDGSLRKL